MHQFPSGSEDHPKQIIRSWLQAKQTALGDPAEVQNTVNMSVLTWKNKQKKSDFRWHHSKM